MDQQYNPVSNATAATVSDTAAATPSAAAGPTFQLHPV
jgi:hypothetical protein